MPFCLVYVSSAVRLFRTGDLLSLLEECRTSNAALGITGALLYQDGNVMQALEGDEQTVRGLFARIARDPRHRDVTVISENEGPREFSGWSMAFGDLSAQSEREPDLVGTVVPSAPARSAATLGVARRLLSSFRQSLNMHGGAA